MLETNQNTPAAIIETQMPYEKTIVENESEDVSEKENSVTENLYFCHHLKGGAAHPGIIVETAGLANIKPPRPTYRPDCQPNSSVPERFPKFSLSALFTPGKRTKAVYRNRTPAPEFPSVTGWESGKQERFWELFLIIGFRDESEWSGSALNSLIKAVKDEMARLGFRIPIQFVSGYQPEEQITMGTASFFALINPWSLNRKKVAGELTN